MDPREPDHGKLHPTKLAPGPTRPGELPSETSTFKEPLQVRTYSRSATPQHRSAVYESLYGSPSRSPAQSIPSPMRGLQSPSNPFESPSRDFLRSPYGYGDFGDQSRSPAPYRTPTMADLADRFSVNVYKLPPMVSPLHATPRRTSESTTRIGNSSVEDSVLSELEAIPQPVYSGPFYPNFKKMAIKSFHDDSDDDLSVNDNEDSEDEEIKTVSRKTQYQGISEVSSFQLPSQSEKDILNQNVVGAPRLDSLNKDQDTYGNSNRKPSHGKPTRLPSSLQEKRITPKKSFLSTLSNLCFFQTGVKITFDQASDEDPNKDCFSEKADQNTLGTINSIELEENFCNPELMSEETVEDTLVFYVTKGKMAVELAPQDHLIDVTEDDNSMFKVLFSSYSDGIEISEFKESLQLPMFTKVVKKGRPSKADLVIRDVIQSHHVQEFLEDNRQRMCDNSPMANFQEIVAFVELLVTLREQNRWQRLDLTLPQIEMNNGYGIQTTTPIQISEHTNVENSSRDALLTSQTKDEIRNDIGSPAIPTCSIKEEIVSLPSHFSNFGSVQMIDVLPGPKSVIEIPKHLEKLVTSKGSFFIQIKFRSSMLGPIILSSKTEILALKELVIMLMKVYKQKESRGRKIELSNLRCQLSLFISQIRDILQPNIVDYLREACTKKGLDAHSMKKRRQYPLRNGTLRIDKSGNIINQSDNQIKIEPEEETSQSAPTETIAFLSNDVNAESLPRDPSPIEDLDKFYKGPILVKKVDKSEHFRNFAAALLPSETRSLTLDKPATPVFLKRKNRPCIQKTQKKKKSPKKARLSIRPGLRSLKSSMETEGIYKLN